MTLRMTVLGLAALLLAVGGCSTDTELGGVKVPNARPDTRITGQPPTLLEAGFSVQFHWTGSDPDNRVKGYQWKISDNGTDGISPRDTLTVDPLTGAEINPWRFTTATDSVFVVLADLPDFPGDTGSAPRSFRTHSLFVRSVDEDDAVDPTPAYISFTSTTLVPQGSVIYPQLTTNQAKRVPPTVNIGWQGTDEDFELRIPTKVRYLWRSAVRADGVIIQVPSQYQGHEDEMVDFEDPTYWSAWQRYAPNAEDRLVSFQEGEEGMGKYFLFAVQFQDTAGAVSDGRRYGVEVANVYIAPGTGPAIQLQETFLGAARNNSAFTVAAGQPLNWVWRADPSGYNGVVLSMRHGWDLKNPNDPNDPGWMVPPGLSEQNKFSRERSFQDGNHIFYLQILDDSRTLITWTVDVEAVPFIPRDSQAELLVIDQIKDNNVQNWIDRDGNARNDESYRNTWWQFLENGPGGVADMDWDLDRFDHRQVPTYKDIVGYKAVLCYAQYYETQTMFADFRSEDGVDIEGQRIKKDKFVWLTPYQERGGNLFLVGDRSMASFLENESNYMTPMVFDTAEPNWQGGNVSFTVSFGERELPDGTKIVRGPLLYPYATAGISTLDWTSANSKYVYGRPQTVAKEQRKSECVGLKGLVLDTGFKDYHAVGPSDFRDTIMTESEIDWHDEALWARGDLAIVSNSFPWREDEFVDANISTRGTVWARQNCDDPAAPGGLCVEPMFRGLARFDWLREFWWSHGDPDWPTEGDPDYWDYGANALNDSCGTMALDSYEKDDGFIMPLGTAKTNEKVFGYFSYKLTGDKPGAAPDVFWGFDPYRFDHDQIKDAIRWVLSRNFGLNVRN